MPTTPSGLQYEDTTVGEGETAQVTSGIGTGQVHALASFDVTYK